MWEKNSSLNTGSMKQNCQDWLRTIFWEFHLRWIRKWSMFLFSDYLLYESEVCFCFVRCKLTYFFKELKRITISWLTNSALVYEPKCGKGGGGGCGVTLSQWVQLYTGAQIKLWRFNSIFNLWKRHSGLLLSRSWAWPPAMMAADVGPRPRSVLNTWREKGGWDRSREWPLD